MRPAFVLPAAPARQAIPLAIVPRPGNDLTEARDARTLRERFGQEYKIITPTEAAQPP